jgi:hypothetical protein
LESGEEVRVDRMVDRRVARMLVGHEKRIFSRVVAEELQPLEEEEVVEKSTFMRSNRCSAGFIKLGISQSSSEK